MRNGEDYETRWGKREEAGWGGGGGGSAYYASPRKHEMNIIKLEGCDCLPACLFVCLPACLSVCLPVCLSPACLFVCLSASPRVRERMYLPV